MFGNSDDLSTNLETFFKDMASRNFVPKVEQLAQVQLEIDPVEDGNKGKGAKDEGGIIANKRRGGRVSLTGKINSSANSEEDEGTGAAASGKTLSYESD